MIHSLFYYLAVTVLLAAVDAIRIRVQWGKKENISKVPSVILAVIAGAVWFILKPTVWLFIPACIGVRLLFYAPVLNLFRGRAITYTSSKTNSKTDQDINSWWLQRIIGAAVLAIVLLINSFL